MIASIYITLSWALVAALMLLGLLGTLLPLLPGAVLILAGAFVYEWLIAAPGQGLGGWTLFGLTLLTAATYVVDLVSALAGAGRYGASRWGVVGGVVGVVLGCFLSLPGMILCPLAGMVVGELLSGKELPLALRSAWGAMVGAAAGLAIRMAVALTMVGWFLFAVFRGN